MGYGVDESAARLSIFFHVLRELVHLSAGHLALEPRFEVKALLGDHLHDDARAATKVLRRIGELRQGGAYPGAAGDQLAQLLDRAENADTHEYLEIAYGELKPTLIHALELHLANVDPLLDEPGLRLLTRLLHRQQRHTTELPTGRDHVAFDDLGALPIRLGEFRPLRVLPPLEQPARDPFIELGDNGADEPPQRVHALMNAELCGAELTARTSHEHPDMPWEFHVDMARRAWDEIRHAEVLDRLMATELDCHWGDHPVGFADFKRRYALDLPGRLAAREATRPIEHDVFDYLQADAAAHRHSATRWT